MKIKFQDKLLQIIDKYTLDSFPRSIILEGKKGSGKHLIVNYICEHLHLTYMDITKNLDFESITSYYLNNEPIIYVIDSSQISEKNQNSILKFLEEPLKNAYIIILTVNKYNLLPTILNRCQIYCLANYTKENLSHFIANTSDNNFILNIAETPGELNSLSNINISNEIEFCLKMISKIDKATFPNALTLSKHIAFNNEQNLIDLSLFVRILKFVILDEIKKGNDYFKTYELTQKLYKDLDIPNIDKKYLFENYLSNLWYYSRG